MTNLCQGKLVMAEKQDPVVLETIPSLAGGVSAIASANAPIIFVDGVPTFGFGSGVVNATLSAARYHGPHTDFVLVAHLRLTVGAARLLSECLQKAIAMGEKPKTPAN